MMAFRLLSLARPFFFDRWPLHLRIAAQMRYGEINHSFHIMPELGILYVSIPKVACTTLKRTFRQIYGVTDAIRPGAIHEVRNQPWQHVTDCGLPGLARMIGDGTLRPVAFVRNPFARALSCYRNQFEYDERNWEQPERVKLRSLLNGEPMRRLSFAGFLEAVSSRKSVEMNGHWRPQADFIMANDIVYSFIGRQEALGEDLAKLGRMIGTDFADIDLPSRNRTGAGTMLGEYYTPQTAELVRRIYAVDFETFGYSLDLPETGVSAPLQGRRLAQNPAKKGERPAKLEGAQS